MTQYQLIDALKGIGINFNCEEITKRAAEEIMRLEVENTILTLKANSEKSFVLISDDDGHWYVCPADKQREAADHFEYSYEYCKYSHPDDYYDVPPVLPDYLVPVGGAPSLVVFQEYRIG